MMLRTGVHADYDRFVLEFEPDINEPDGSPDSFHVFWADGIPLIYGEWRPNICNRRVCA